jgi:hypothetical protein
MLQIVDHVFSHAIKPVVLFGSLLLYNIAEYGSAGLLQLSGPFHGSNAALEEAGERSHGALTLTI